MGIHTDSGIKAFLNFYGEISLDTLCKFFDYKEVGEGSLMLKKRMMEIRDRKNETIQ